jgi:hypothetical protein
MVFGGGAGGEERFVKVWVAWWLCVGAEEIVMFLNVFSPLVGW